MSELTDAERAGEGAGLLVVLSGPSGVGKTTIAREVVKRLGAAFSVSATTRPAGPGEVEGQDYYFLSDAEFDRRIQAGEFLEYARVFGRHCYGTPRGPVESRLGVGELVLLEIDVQGGIQVRDVMPGAFLVFILPPSEEELLRRLRDRGRDSEDAIRHRFAQAKAEIEKARQCGAYDTFVVNHDLEEAIEQTCQRIRARQREAANRAV